MHDLVHVGPSGVRVEDGRVLHHGAAAENAIAVEVRSLKPLAPDDLTLGIECVNGSIGEDASTIGWESATNEVVKGVLGAGTEAAFEVELLSGSVRPRDRNTGVCLC